jgi:hypothetical protein
MKLFSKKTALLVKLSCAKQALHVITSVNKGLMLDYWPEY